LAGVGVLLVCLVGAGAGLGTFEERLNRLGSIIV
jgi:hypothetical protein